jgi:flagellar biosynthesis GTPase FlhF
VYRKLLVILLAGVTAAFAADITTRDGTTYHNVEITGIDPDGIRVMHSKGVAKLRFEELPDPLQKQYHYNAAKVAAYRKQIENAQKAAAAQATATEQQRQRQVQQAQEEERRRAEEARRLEQERMASEEREKPEDDEARKTAEAFLAAVKIAEVPEGLQAARDAAWHIGNLPVLLEYTTLFEGMFDTDIAGIRGYKRLLETKIQSKGGVPLTAKYILISYKDRTSGKWKVFDFRELEATSAEEEAAAAKRDLGDTKYIKDQFNYRNYAYWLILSGRLREAGQAIHTSIAINNRSPDPNFSQRDCDETLSTIQRISAK